MKLFDWFKEQPVTEPAATGEAREPFPSPEFWLNDYIREVDNHSWFWRCPWCPTTGHRPGGRDPNAWSAERAYLDLTTHVLGHMAERLLGPPTRRSALYDWSTDVNSGLWIEGDEFEESDDDDGS